TEASEHWQVRTAQLEAAEVVWKQSLAEQRGALESSRVECGRLEAQLAVSTAEAMQLRGQVQDLHRQIEDLNQALPMRAAEASQQKREFEAAAADLRREADSIRRELQALRDSMSWKRMGPLRSVQRFLAKQLRSARKRRAEGRELFMRAAVRLHPT